MWRGGVFIVLSIHPIHYTEEREKEEEGEEGEGGEWKSRPIVQPPDIEGKRRIKSSSVVEPASCFLIFQLFLETFDW